ncbi:XdhC family protein [Streptomyces sp. MMG1533]|uniref:XdhC family protein n=1 Tax=Streptomyces sp. MMG1533 TaxID=1415546 RepID=UPI0007C6ED3C|nr:XdhC family protein [Streptomyces sp. MMG1533]
MDDITEQLRAWCAERRPFALATVVAVRGSAPRGPGACVAVDASGTVVGSISGGCVEGAVYELAREVLDTRRARRAVFGYSDDDAFAVGLTCGGTIDVLVRPVTGAARAVLHEHLEELARGRPAALATVTDGPPELLGAAIAVGDRGHLGEIGPPALDAAVARDARTLLALGTGGTRSYDPAGSCAPAADGIGVHIAVHAAPPRMLVYGAIDFAAAVARVGTFLGHHVTVCDARPVFTTHERFPDADEVVVDWPHRHLRGLADDGALDGRTAVCVLTHDARFDLPLLELALRLPVGYVGAMGSRRTHAQRLDGLRAAGLDEAELARLHSPIGLDIGAATSEETAVSVAAEIIARRGGGSGRSLRDVRGPLHRLRPGRTAADAEGGDMAQPDATATWTPSYEVREMS